RRVAEVDDREAAKAEPDSAGLVLRDPRPRSVGPAVREPIAHPVDQRGIDLRRGDNGDDPAHGVSSPATAGPPRAGGLPRGGASGVPAAAEQANRRAGPRCAPDRAWRATA